MPIYEYQCESCGHELEILQKISDPRLSDCPECNNATLVKKISAPSFRLKGGGWYETDFKTGNKRNLAGEDKPADTAAKTEKADKTPDKTVKAAATKDSSPGKASAGTTRPAGKSD